MAVSVCCVHEMRSVDLSANKEWSTTQSSQIQAKLVAKKLALQALARRVSVSYFASSALLAECLVSYLSVKAPRAEGPVSYLSV